ncbi:MAG: hypothetical protein IT318_24740 [Anaerolineales bacterium]|nr:hypothetical protein [Anaerolineales bacterium]
MGKSSRRPARVSAPVKRQLPPAPPVPPPGPAPDVEALARAARANRIAQCEKEVLAALGPILERHRCRLGTVQEVIDGQPGPVQVRVFALGD